MLRKVLFSSAVLCSLFCAVPALLAQNGNGGFVYTMDLSCEESENI
jgi:hypothetical protein